jgi:uracil-DNA glycosylase
MVIGSQRVHSSWDPILEPFTDEIARIFAALSVAPVAPPLDKVFLALECNLDQVKCVIVGQDPYPTEGNAHGLACSVPRNVKKIPASLQNIFKELHSDLGIPAPASGNLEPWRDRGVLLLNRVLTTEVGRSNAHFDLGWQRVTEAIAKACAVRGAVGLLWGKYAQELEPLFSKSVTSVHPSPLSAYRGFFGSKPFSKVNELLIEQGSTPIDWSL